MTGGIGAGKSALVAALARHGAAVFSADAAVHALYEGSDVRDAVVARWGERVLGPDGSVDRGRIADIVFHDDDELAWLEGLLHPLVAREWMRFVHEQMQAAAPPAAIVAEVPLLFEAGLASRYDATVLVTAPLDVRLRRVGDRAHGSSHAVERARQQLSDQEKAELADYVLVNDDGIDAVDTFADELLAQVSR